MCGLCGILVGQGHWTDSSSNPAVFASRQTQHTWHRERQDRVRLLNQVLRHYHLSLADWSGNKLVLRNRTGQTALINNLAELWIAAEKLGKTKCDPLDQQLLDALEPGNGGI